MASQAAKGNCYICGKTVSKTAAKKHLNLHGYDGEKPQQCMLLKIEDRYDKDYWIYADIPLTSTLKALDTFIRDIWVECCGHLSCFFYGMREELAFGTKIASIQEGTVLGYEYDFGSTTELKVTFVEVVERKKQQKAVRLLMRNIQPEASCRECGAPAEYICCECQYDDDVSPYFCGDCAAKHESEEEHYILPVVNSPRMGVCGYDGGRPEYDFDIKKFK